MADERTANEALRSSALSVSNAARIAGSRSAGNGVCSIQRADLGPRLGERAHIVDVERRQALRDAVGQSLVGEKARNAFAVVAKPPGTRTPDAASWLIISPE